MSSSLSHSAANTMRPTKVRASVGSSTSGSSARPTRRACAPAAPAVIDSSRAGSNLVDKGFIVTLRKEE